MDKAREARRSSEETNVKIGIMLNSQFAPGTHTAAAFRETVEQVRLMRELGFDSVWVGQHYLAAHSRSSASCTGRQRGAASRSRLPRMCASRPRALA